MSNLRTIADLISYTKANNSQPHRQRIILGSKLKRFSEVVGFPAAMIELNIASIRQLMDTASPGAVGVSKSNWAKICSGVWLAMERAGIAVVRATGFVCSEPIERLLSHISGDKQQLTLTPILKFLSSTSTDPWSFSQADIPKFREWLRANYSRTNWQKSLRRSIKVWTDLQGRFPVVWPQNPLEVVFDEDDFYLTWDAFPDLKRAWDQHVLEIKTPKTRRYGRKKKIIADTTILAREGYVRRFASAVAHAMNLRPEQVNSFEYITDPEVVDETVCLLIERCRKDYSGNIYQMLRHINAIAKHHVKRDETDIEQLVDIRSSVAPPDAPADKNIEVVRKFRSETLRVAFVKMPANALRQLKSKPQLSTVEAKFGMLAFLAALLTRIPMRISEALALQFGETLIEQGGGKQRAVIINLAAEHVKNGQPRNAPLGASLVELYDIYMSLIRPKLAPVTNRYLFPSGPSGSRNSDHISTSLASMMRDQLGVRMTPHQFRHVVGYIFLKDNPGCYDTVRRFLGHRSLKTTLRFYAFVLEDDANASLDAAVDSLQQRHAASARRRRT